MVRLNSRVNKTRNFQLHNYNIAKKKLEKKINTTTTVTNCSYTYV